MTLLFDLISTQPNNDGLFHGGGKYAKKVFSSLFPYQWKDVSVIGVYDGSKPLDPYVKDIVDTNGVELVDVTDSNLADIVRSRQIERLFSAQPFGLIKHGLTEVDASSCSIIATVHGLRTLEVQMQWAHLKYFSMFKLKTFLKAIGKIVMANYIMKRDVKRYSDLFKIASVITVSKHTKYAIMSFFPTLDADIPVFYSPDVTEFSDDEEANISFELSDYFLLVSGNRWLKNNLCAALALDELFSERPEITNKVIITGVSDENIYRKRLRNNGRFIFYKYVSESHLRELYKNSFAFLYLSLNEGFGYPPLEAMKWGIPVITSPFTSIPEICGDAVLYSNPYSIDEVKSRVIQLFEADEYNLLKSKGIRRYEFIKNKQDEDLAKTCNLLLS